MMDFLEKLYSKEYFAPVLFTVIAILAVLFVIVLILALRDAKKKKALENAAANDAFAKVNEEPQEVNISVATPEVPEVKEENVVNSVEATPAGFENVEVPAPVVESNETPIVTAPTFEAATPDVPVEEPQDIKIEEAPKVEVNQEQSAMNDLDSIASTLLSQYKKEEAPKVEAPVEAPSVAPVQSEAVASDIPNFGDIPVPQPVRVTDSANVIDSSSQNVANIQAEEYNINK